MALFYEVVDGLAGQMSDIPPGSIVNRLIFSNRQVEVNLVGFAPGQELSETSPVSAAILEILRGDGHVTLARQFEAEIYEISAGSWIYIERGTPHTIQSRTEMIVLVTVLRESSNGREIR